MANIGNLVLNARGMGTGGARIQTAVTQVAEESGIKQTMLDIADDLDAANTEGAFGVTLLVTAARLGKFGTRDTDYGQGGGALPSGGPNGLRQLMVDLAVDIAAIDTAGSGFVIVHTAAKISRDFMSGGKHMHRNPAFGQKRPSEDNGGVPTPGVGPDGKYDWIVQALNAVANDIASIKAADTLTFTPKTIPV